MPLAPYRIAQAPEPEGPEDDNAPFAARLRRQALRAQIITAVFGIGMVAAVYSTMALRTTSAASRWAEHTRAQEAARHAWIQDSLAHAGAKANLEQKNFADSLKTAVANDVLMGRPLALTTSSCPVALPREAGIVRGRSAFPLVITSRGEAEEGSVTSPTVRVVRSDIERAVAHDANGSSEEAALYARALEHPDRYRFDVVLVTDKKKDPIVTTTTSYEPGETSGRVYVYDFATHTVVCRGDIRASSSKELGYAYASEPDAPRALERKASLEATLDADFQWQIERSIVTASLSPL